VGAGVETADDRIDDARGAVHDVERWTPDRQGGPKVLLRFAES
jgi:hypothetical protein